MKTSRFLRMSTLVFAWGAALSACSLIASPDELVPAVLNGTGGDDGGMGGEDSSAGGRSDIGGTTSKPCKKDEHVEDHVCVTCAAGTTNDAGDDASGVDSSCDAVLCASDERVEDHVCTACPEEMTNDAGDDASGADTSCDDACSLAFAVSCNEFQQAYLKASNTDEGDWFGKSVSLSGDTLAVAALDESSAATGVDGDQTNNDAASSGAVYLFTRTAGVWKQQAYLKASNTEAGDRFGTSLSLSGDTLAVGASGEDSAATGVDGDQTNNDAASSGAVYLFTRTAGVWKQQAYLKASNTESGEEFGHEEFGHSVSLSGDTLAVGAPFEGSSATGVDGIQTNNDARSSGAVYLFTRTAGVWKQQAYLKASNTETYDFFGNSLSLSGDTLAVGAPGEGSVAIGVDGVQANNDAEGSGAVYLFTRTAGVWKQQAYLKASNTEVADSFGSSVSLAGDTLAVGAPYEDSAARGVDGDQTNNDAAESGATYLFTRSAGVWKQQAYLKASNTSNTEEWNIFGSSVSLSGDTLAVGALGENSAATGVDGDQTNNEAIRSGAVYLFTRTADVWKQQAYLKASNTGANDYFGYSVSLDGDTLAVGASTESSAATGVDGDQTNDDAAESGAVYLRLVALTP